MLNRIAIGLFAIIVFASCTGKVPRPFPVEIILDAPISNNGKYPASFGKLFLPIDFDEEIFLIPKPIRIRRVDTGGNAVELNAYSFEDKGDPTIELYQNWMPIFFNDSIPNKELITAKGETTTSIEWVLKNADKQAYIVMTNDDIAALSGKENVFLCEDENAVSKKILELLKANPEAKISLVIPSTIPIINEPKAYIPEPIETFRKQLEIEHDDAKTWQELYQKAALFILTEEEHAYDHPSAYCYIVCAAEKAIETGKSQEMYDQMRLDCPSNAISQKICRLKTKDHVEIWNKVLAGVLAKDSEALEAIEDNLFSVWTTHLKGEVAAQTIEKFEGEMEHADAKNWQELYYKAAQYLLSEEEHAYDHPSAYCYLVCAAEKAIETGKTAEMKKAMESVCDGTDSQSKNLCKLKKGHEKNWNAVMNGVGNADSKTLEELEEGIMSRWLQHLKG